MSELIDNEFLISLIQERPVLWDKTLEIYRDRTATENAWREVCREIRDDFERLEEKERKNFGKEVMKRWKNLRDAFYKAEKKAKEDRTSGSQASKRRKYIFNNELKFFKKIFEKAATTENFTIEEGSRTESEGSLQQLESMEPERSLITEAKEKTVSNTQARRRHKKLDEIDLKILNALEKSAPEKPNSQMSFFHSLLRHTENFDNDEWLQFQVEVLRVISRY
ncbi:unnamed protein product [Larinioides sclopetarius]|uniref:MADF domain-containing protein n=2 Tax=Larinioides sclopetarius TaxID=280406 RepID=A0AAV1ZK42_9ARAC